jgi:hypothetical protein
MNERDEFNAAYKAVFEEGFVNVKELSWQIWQAARAKPVVPPVHVMAKALSDRHAEECNIDKDDNWKVYGQDYIDDVEAMLAAAKAGGSR